MSFNLEGEKVLLTGASGGIGIAIAKYLVDLGVNLAISGTSEEKLLSLNNELKNKAKIFPQDLSDLNNVEKLIEKVSQEIGGLDGLICNAGITDDKLSLRMTLDSWQKVMNINLTSTFLLNKQACKFMLKQKKGKIINISSVVGFIGSAGQANYAASKAGMIAMSKSLAKEFATKNIQINCIAPGFIRTNMTDKLTEEQKAEIIKHIPMARMAEPEELCGVIALLLSNLSSYITGQTFHINGGMLML